ncbi:WD40-repeat-containing domain protein [Paraphysoderma sedebokerense]|nr:WD40-repeat-containing domain protein [Paraphysoderma sedebokerense]
MTVKETFEQLKYLEWLFPWSRITRSMNQVSMSSKMQIYTGDENGLLKAVDIPLSRLNPEEVPIPKPSPKDESSQTESNEKPKLEIKAFGTMNKSLGIQTLGMFDFGEKMGNQLVIGRNSGQLDVFNPNTETLTFSLAIFNGNAVHPETKEREAFVGVDVLNGLLRILTTHGNLFYIDVSSGFNLPSPTTYPSPGASAESNASSLKIYKHNIGANISACIFHPLHPNIVIVGGKERELAIYDVNHTPLTDSTEKPQSKKQNSAKDRWTGLSTQDRKTFDPEKWNVVEIWKAKNVKNDMLDLRQPVHITTMGLINNDGTEIVVGTQYHQIRLYDTKRARRPVLNVEHGEFPIRRLVVIPEKREIVFTDTSGILTHFDLATGKPRGVFKGPVGAVKGLYIYSSSRSDAPTDIYLIAVGLDRWLRIWNVYGSRKLVKKVFLKSRLECVLATLGVEDAVPESEGVIDEVDELWNEMDTVGETPNELKSSVKPSKGTKRKVAKNTANTSDHDTNALLTRKKKLKVGGKWTVKDI